MTVNALNINSNCGKNFHFCLENGSDDYLFVLFKSNCTVYTDKGYVNVRPGSFALFDKNLKQEYFSDDCDFIHDYIRFNFDKNSEEIFLSKIKMHSIFSTDSSEEIEAIFKLAAMEFNSEYKYKNNSLELLLKLLLTKAAEYTYNPVFDNDSKYRIKFIQLRTDIYSNPQKYDSLDDIASSIHLSKSYFQALYKKYFNVSCIIDIIKARLEKAKLFLSDTDKSVSEIAYLCGYSNIEHFTRQFKKIEGITPTAYRKNI